jgi:hypothetical protein
MLLIYLEPEKRQPRSRPRHIASPPTEAQHGDNVKFCMLLFCAAISDPVMVNMLQCMLQLSHGL